MKLTEVGSVLGLEKCANRFEVWDKILNEVDAKAFAEIGVWKGDFAAFMLCKSPNINRYYMLDPWSNLSDWNKPANISVERFDEIYDEAMKKTAFAREKIVVLRGRTKDVIDEIPDGSLDAAYVDGDHTLRGICIDLIKLAPKIKPGGYIGGDDFTTTPWQHSIHFEPTLVCPFSVHFAEAMDYPIAALPFSQFLIKKTDEEKFCFTDTIGKYSDLSLNKLQISYRYKGSVFTHVKRRINALRKILR